MAGGITLAWGACSRSEICTGLSPRHFCAVVGLCSGPALTTRGRHIQRLVCSTWARNRFGDRPLLRRAHDLRTLALTLRWAESSATPRHFCAGVRLCSGPALTTRGRHTQRLVCPTWARDRVGDRPLLRWAHDPRMSGPYFALGRDRATFALGPGPLALPLLCAGPRLCHSYAYSRVPDPGTFLESRHPFYIAARSPCARGSPRPRSPSLAPFA